MNYSFHPAAEAEFLESVGYYESAVPGLAGSALIREPAPALTNPSLHIEQRAFAN